MAASGPTCNYVLDPAKPATWHGDPGDECLVDESMLNENGVWTCPHAAEADTDRCLFHRPVTQKDDAEVVDTLFERLEAAQEQDNPDPRQLQFLGAEFGAIERFREIPLELTIETGAVALTHATFAGEFHWGNEYHSQAEFAVPRFDLAGIHCKQDATFDEVTFPGGVTFRGATFEGDASFKSIKFANNADFTNVTFEAGAQFSRTRFLRDGIFLDTAFGGATSIRGEFRGPAYFNDAAFAAGASIGATFTDYTDFSNTSFEGPANFRRVELTGDGTFVGATFGAAANFRQATLTDVDFRFVTFQRDAEFNAVEFVGRNTFSRARFEQSAIFRDATFGAVTEFGGVEWPEFVSFIDAEFSGRVDFWQAMFGGRTSLANAVFEGPARFPFVKFTGRSRFAGAEFTAGADFRLARFAGPTDWTDTVFAETVSFRKAIVEQEMNFDATTFTETADFAEVSFTDDVSFGGADLAGATFKQADLSDGSFDQTNLRGANLEGAILARASLLGTDLRDARLARAMLGDVYIDHETAFLNRPGDDGAREHHSIAGVFSQPTCVYDPSHEQETPHTDVDKAKSVYRTLEELGRKHARPRLQAQSFVRRQDLHTAGYKQAVLGAEAWEQRLVAGARWARAKVARTTLLYGESPWRVIAWSLGIILSFALLYPLGGWIMPADGAPITYTQIAATPAELFNSVYYSTLTYTALGFGDFQPVGLGRLLTTIETGLGAVMLALLVFILGRRAAR